MRFWKVQLPITLALFMAVIAITSQFVAHHYSNNFIQETAVWSRVIAGVTMFIGAYSLLRVHYNKIKRQQKAWGYSGVLFVFFGVMVTFGILNYGVPKADNLQAVTYEEAFGQPAPAQPAEALPKPKDGKEAVALKAESGKPFTDPKGKPLYCLIDPESKAGNPIRALTDSDNKQMMGPGGKRFYADLQTAQVTENPPAEFLGPLKPRPTLDEGTKWVYTAVQQPAGATQYSLLGFFICSAAYRTFRAKSSEAAALLIAALIVMLGQVPIAALIWKEIPHVSQWLMDVPNMAVKRAIGFGICVGAVGTSLRVMFGIERSYMGGD